MLQLNVCLIYNLLILTVLIILEGYLDLYLNILIMFLNTVLNSVYTRSLKILLCYKNW